MAISEKERRRNRMLGAVLGCAAALMLVAVFGTVLMLHYAQAHHLLAVR